jgi:endonuclease/exonuclease/phosphatase family metal-dependent hydrolase
MDMRFGTWNVRSMYRASSLGAVGEEISEYKLDLVGVQEVTSFADRRRSLDRYSSRAD